MRSDLPNPGRVLDAGALKALAHPLRFQLIELLIEHGPSTASDLGRRVGESSGTTSYHLRQLAVHGLIEEAPELGSARDRWWRPVPGGWTIDGFEVLQREETRDDAQAILDEVLRARNQRIRAWHRDAHRWGADWVAASVEMTARLHLTRDEAAALTRELVEVLDRYRDLQSDRKEGRVHVPDAVPVTVQIDGYPSGEPPAVEPSAGEPPAGETGAGDGGTKDAGRE